MNAPSGPVSTTEIAELIAWARRLSIAGPNTAELAAFQAAKAQLLARIDNQHTGTPDFREDTR